MLAEDGFLCMQGRCYRRGCSQWHACSCMDDTVGFEQQVVDGTAGSSSSSSIDTAGQLHHGTSNSKLEAAANGTAHRTPNGTTANGSTHAGSSAHPAKQPVAAQTHSKLADTDGGDSTSEADGAEHHGMVLPFTPVTLTFRDVHYYVPAEVRIPMRVELDMLSVRISSILCPPEHQQRPFGTRRC